MALIVAIKYDDYICYTDKELSYSSEHSVMFSTN